MERNGLTFDNTRRHVEISKDVTEGNNELVRYSWIVWDIACKEDNKAINYDINKLGSYDMTLEGNEVL